MLDLCQRHQVKLVVPTIDTELPLLAESRDRFQSLGVAVSVSSPVVVGAARDKQATFELLRSADVGVPATCSAEEYLRKPEAFAWPVILKPRGGSSSVGIVRPRLAQEAIEELQRNAGLIVQHFWEGKEYTVNMYFDYSGGLRCVVPHWRIETRGGEVSKGRTEDVAVLRQAACKIATVMPGARGAICFQAIVDASGAYAVFEINARLGGGYPLAHQAGATFTKWLLEEALGLPCTAADTWRAGVEMLRYDTAVFRSV
jgi:carbamoyl-phosphate synthase large subunit